jgi:hypothetical protein
MRFAAAIALIVLNSTVFATTNATVTVSDSATNAVSVKVSRKMLKPARPQCKATTLSGNRCKRHAVDGSKYCRQHESIFRKHEKKDQQGTHAAEPL